MVPKVRGAPGCLLGMKASHPRVKNTASSQAAADQQWERLMDAEFLTYQWPVSAFISYSVVSRFIQLCFQ